MEAHAILVGVNTLDPTYYLQNSYPMEEANKNVTSMYEFMKDDVGFNPINIKILSGNSTIAPTWNNFQTQLLNLRNLNQTSPQFVLIYISCHGVKIRFNHPDYTDKNFLCFQDKLVLENELRKEIEQFTINFKVNVIIDACYSDGLDIDYVHTNQISESSFTPVYKHHELTLNQVIASFGAKRDPNYVADTCFMYSVQQHIPAVFSNNPNLPSIFTGYLINLWKNYVKPTDGIPLNYFDFINLLMKNFIRSPFQPVVRIYPSKIQYSNFFISTAAFRFNQSPMMVNQDFLQVAIKEVIDSPLEVSLIGLQPDYESTLAPNVLDKMIDGFSDEWQLLVKKIIDISPFLMDNIAYIVQIFVHVKPGAGKPLKKVIEGVKSIESSQTNIGGTALVIICDGSNNNKIVGHKRTRGKVSNKLG